MIDTDICEKTMTISQLGLYCIGIYLLIIEEEDQNDKRTMDRIIVIINKNIDNLIKMIKKADQENYEEID